jgi:hypothetical protein
MTLVLARRAIRASATNRSIALLLCSLLLVTACAPQPPSRYAEVQKETSQKGNQAVSKEAQRGGSFNQFFPKSGNGYAVVPAQEKKGFAEYKVNKGGKNLAVLSISDTVSLPTAADKYKQSSFKIAGFPAVDQGQNSTGILVNGRYQVKAQSRDPAFTRQDRIAWIQKFDLDGLSRL